MGAETSDRAGAPTGAVFLSYASQDLDAAQRIAAALRAAGIEVWFDQSALRGGDAWDQAIRRQIKTCALFIPVISRNTHERAEGYFRLEWKLAVDRSHLIVANRAFLLPVVIDDTGDDDEYVPETFKECIGRVCRLERRPQRSCGDAGGYQYAEIYAQWGENKVALDWLEKAMHLHDSGMSNLRVDALLDPLRQEPRFQAIDRALKFPQ